MAPSRERAHEATKIPSLRGFAASCENTTDYVSETGEVVASYAYDAFGRTLSATGPMADAFPFRFSTKYYDSETGLYYYGRRYYSPDLGRWLNRDPIEEEGGVNLYAFCGNNGVGAFDALGDRHFGPWANTFGHIAPEFSHANFAHQPEFLRLNSPDEYLMTPYVALGYKPMKKIKMFRNGIPNSKFGYKYVLVPSYTDIATEDYDPGFIQWAQSFYGATWRKIKEITNETDSRFR